MYYVSWNKYLNRSSSELDLKPSKPLKISPFELPTKATINRSANPPKTQLSTTISPTSAPSSSAETAASTFTLFTQLPTELRLKIWEHYHASTPPQLLTFRLCPTDVDHVPHRRKACFAHPHMLALRQRSIPTILHTCSESREVGLSHYRLGFDVAADENRNSCCHEHEDLMEKHTLRKLAERTEIYWDPTKDVVHLEVGLAPSSSTVYTWGSITYSTTSDSSSNICFKDIKYLALKTKTWFQLADARFGTTSFSNLEGVLMIGKWNEMRVLRSAHIVNGAALVEKFRDKFFRMWETNIRGWCARVGTEAEVVEVKLIENLGGILNGLQR